MQTALGFGANINLDCTIISMGVDLEKQDANSRTTQLTINSSWDSRCF